jgi:hypothetical protein
VALNLRPRRVGRIVRKVHWTEGSLTELQELVLQTYNVPVRHCFGGIRF